MSHPVDGPELEALRERFPAILRARAEVAETASGAYEAHIDVLLPQHQIILNREGADAEGALHAAVDAATREIEALARRERDLAARYGIKQAA